MFSGGAFHKRRLGNSEGEGEGSNFIDIYQGAEVKNFEHEGRGVSKNLKNIVSFMDNIWRTMILSGGAVHKRRRQFGGAGEGSNFIDICQGAEVENFRHGGGGCIPVGNLRSMGHLDLTFIGFTFFTNADVVTI